MQLVTVANLGLSVKTKSPEVCGDGVLGLVALLFLIG